jgi:nucleoside diphosphate kinase
MKHVKLYEQFVAEKVYRLTGIYASKGIIGKVMQAFKKQIEGVKFEGNAEDTLKEINDTWEDFKKDAIKIILADVDKAVKDIEEVFYVHVTGLAGTGTWVLDTVNNLNREGADTIYICLDKEFVINVGFMDDADASKYSRKLGGSTNTAIASGEDIHGTFDAEIGYNNIEIRGNEFMNIDAK